MNYGLIYTIPFATLDNTPCVVEIEKDNYSGSVQELTPGENPFTADITDEEFLYAPTRFSTATIRIVGNDYLQSLFSTAYQQYRVTFKKDGVITWCGFIKPELYTQDYSSDVFELELECMSGMSTLEFIDYKQIGENRQFISLWELLKRCVSSAKSRYSGVYIPHVYALNSEEYTAGTNVLENMTVSEQNFFDEDDKPMKLKEVLEEICKFLNWTCTDWKGDLYFIDIDHTGEFYRYSPDLSTIEKRISPALLNVQAIGFAGSEHALDILPGYNKVTIRCSNYPITNLIQNEDFDNLKILQTSPELEDGNGRCHRRYLNPSKIELSQWEYAGGEIFNKVQNLSDYTKDISTLVGAVPVQYCNYEIKDGAPSIQEYNYTNAIQILNKVDTPTEPGVAFFRGNALTIKGPCAAYKDGCLVISGGVNPIRAANMSPLNKEYPFNSYTIQDCSLRVGNNHYQYRSDGYGTNGWHKNSDKNHPVHLKFERSNHSDEYMLLPNQKTLDKPYPGAAGMIIELPNYTLTGDFEFKIDILVDRYNANYDWQYGVLLKDLKIEFIKAEWVNSSTDGDDRIYENVVNENYTNELDEIEFKISSYNNDGACYSKVMLGDQYLTDNLYSAIEETAIRPEEQLIRRIVKRYSSPHLKLTQVIKQTSDLTPISRLYDNYMVNKRFINMGGSIDFKMDRFSCIMIEV